MKNWVINNITNKLSGKKLVWTRYLKIYCDAGGQIFHWIPKFRLDTFNEYWKLKGISIHVIGREFNIVYGKDVMKFYEK